MPARKKNPYLYEEFISEVLTITPQIAEEMMAYNVGNRNQRKANLSKFSRDMVAGNWKLNGTSIKFSKSGRMIDGQNRLLSCIESGASFVTVVQYGLDDDTQTTIDVGSPRTLADALQMTGYENAAALQTAIFVHRHWVDNDYIHCMNQPPGYTRATIPEGMTHLASYPGLEEATRIALSIRVKIGMSSIGAMAVAHYECSRLDLEATEDFYSRLANYQTTGKGDPVATLLQRLSIMRQRREKMLAATGLFLLFRSWNAYRKGERLTQLLLGSETSGWARIPPPR